MKKILITTLLLFAMTFVLQAQSSRERYDFQYLLELYERQEDNLATSELGRFRNRYPQSSFRQYLDFFEANITLRRGNAQQSLHQFERLLEQNLSPEIKPDVMLGAIVSSHFSGFTSLSETYIQKVITEIQDSQVAANAYYYRGLIQLEKEQYYSAELSFRSALHFENDMPKAKMELFKTLLKLDRETDARELLEKIPLQDHLSGYSYHWLGYLLGKAKYEDFDRYVSALNQEHIELPVELVLIVIKHDIMLRRFEHALALLDTIPKDMHHQIYFRAIALAETGKIAEADSMFSFLAKEADADISVLSYLGRLKILFERDPKAAISQLRIFIDSETTAILKANQYFLLGLFYYKENNTINALKYLNRALLADLDAEFHDQTNYLISHIWFKENRLDNASQSFNRYLNLFPHGRFRDRAWFYLGQISFTKKNYSEAQNYFSRLIQSHRESDLLPEARFYLAEIDFNRANYTQALVKYLDLLAAEPNQTRLFYRIAQSHFYEGRYENALIYLEQIHTEERDYEFSILKASILFNLKHFDAALSQYQIAEKLTRDPIRITESRSYQALVLYQQKRFFEASKLFQQLSGEPGSPDTYLYLSAKSSFLARDYHQAIQLYDSFIDTYPESKYFLPVINELANVYYNMANYDLAVTTWLNTISRFANKLPLTEEDIRFLTDVFAGLELGLRLADSEDFIDEIVAMLDSIRSDFMKFELQFILLKLYADRSLWQELYSQAEDIRRLYPQKQRHEVEFLMADALINLNEYAHADSVLRALAVKEQNPKVLNRWAELDLLVEDYESAFNKYQRSFELKADPAIWTNIIVLGYENKLGDFDDLWDTGRELPEKPIRAEAYRMRYFFERQRFFEADSLANHIIESSAESVYHAQAFLITAKIFYVMGENSESIRYLRQMRVLFPEFPDLVAESYYYNILALFEDNMFDEAQSMFEKEIDKFNALQRAEIESIIAAHKTVDES